MFLCGFRKVTTHILLELNKLFKPPPMIGWKIHRPEAESGAVYLHEMLTF